jgi:hypothetical protein
MPEEAFFCCLSRRWSFVRITEAMLKGVSNVALISLDLHKIIAVFIEQSLRQRTRGIDRVSSDQLE